MQQSANRVCSVGAVSFLNARPLIFGLDRDPRVRLTLDVPAGLGRRLDDGTFEAALVPTIDIARAGRRWRILETAGCIASDDETLTVRVFSRLPLDRVERLCVDADSHTSVALARIVLARRLGRPPEIVTTDMRAMLSRPPAERADAVLLIGDKVIAAGPNDPASPWPVQLDLGRAWREQTGLPFVFAAWASLAERAEAELGELPDLLATAKSAGLRNLRKIAAEVAPALGWPAELAEVYLTQHLAFELTPARRSGLRRFFELVSEEGLL